MKKNKGFIGGALTGALAVLLVIGSVSCAHGAGTTEEQVINSDSEEKLELLEGLVNEYYKGETDETALTEGLYKGYIDGLGDPYSVYYTEEETKDMEESTSGEYSGVGAVLTQDADTGVITVVQVYPNSPAEEAGIQADDILYKVAGEEVTGVDLTEVVSHIRGEEGTDVELAVIRDGKSDEIDLVATRRKIQVETVSYEMKEDKIGYIRVTEFDTVTYQQYKKALEDLKGQGMQGLVVDLRNNPGGSLDTVVNMLDLMLPEGTVVSMKDKSEEETVYTSDADQMYDGPLAVLMNGNSASASEIYAGAIQDFGAGKIVGTQSFGKGIVQQIFDLKDGTSVKLTIAEYYTPSGTCIHGKGVTPDVEIKYEADENNKDQDNQLDKAIEVVKNK